VELSATKVGLFVLGVVACLGIVAVALVVIYKNNNTTAALRPVNRAVQVPESSNAILREINSNISSLNSNINSQIPDGEMIDRNVDVTEQIGELYHQKDGFPWSSCTITNNGPSSVYFSVNEWRNPESPLQVGQTISIDLKQRESIHRVYLKCNNGETSNVDLHVIR